MFNNLTLYAFAFFFVAGLVWSLESLLNGNLDIFLFRLIGTLILCLAGTEVTLRKGGQSLKSLIKKK